jgi:SUMO ligase MMS21 Smc5/6 complex component
MVKAALREDDMPAMTDLLPHEANDGEDDDDDDIVAYGGDRHKYRCPISLQTMVEPIKSTVCPHAFEKRSILEFLGNSTKPCPVGCGKSINKKTLKEDPLFTSACRKFARREQVRKETQRTQVQATMLD